MPLADLNEIGRCALTGAATHIITEYFPDGHPFAGKPRKVGEVLDCCYDVWLLLLNGTQMRVSIHEDCLDEIIPNISRLWSNIINAFVIEKEVAASGAIINPKNRRQETEQKDALLSLISTPPLGILTVERTIDRVKRERAARSH